MLSVSGKEIKSSISMPEAIDYVAKGFSDFNDGLFQVQWGNGEPVYKW